ncbi:MAG: pyrroline-5-carboxylate reductase [Brevinematia bacterium]
MEKLNKNLGFIGFGNMGSALAKGLLYAKDSIIPNENFYVYDKDENKMKEARNAGLKTLDSVTSLFNTCNIIFLCVKPKDLTNSLREVKHMINEAIDKRNEAYLSLIKDKVLISILAGIRVEKIEEAIGGQVQIVRVMPNTPTLVGEGAFGIFFSEKVEEKNRGIVLKLFEQLGKGVVVENEDLIDVVTGLSGSGPAYIFMVIQALADGGVRMGLSRNDALLLSAQTVLGSAKMVLENFSKLHPEALKDMVMSPGGTTAEGIKALEENRLRFAFIKAVEEATKKSRELSK